MTKKEFSSPCGAVRRSTYLASGNEFKNGLADDTKTAVKIVSFRPTSGNEFKNIYTKKRSKICQKMLVFVPPTEGSLLGDRRKYPCGIRGMSLKTDYKSSEK